MKTAFKSDIGRHRKQNQDRVALFTNEQGLFLVVIADGIGGNQRGDLAAELTTKSFGRAFTTVSPMTPQMASKWLVSQVQLINNKILEKSKEKQSYHGMGTTMVAAVLFDDQVVVANIGDSRGYIMHDGQLTQITVDHSLVNELVKKGDLTEQEAQNSPQNNIITRAIGIYAEAKADVNRFRLKRGDQLLLCTDGLSKMVPLQQISEVLTSRKSLKRKCGLLIKMANKAGGPDNITVSISQ